VQSNWRELFQYRLGNTLADLESRYRKIKSEARGKTDWLEAAWAKVQIFFAGLEAYDKAAEAADAALKIAKRVKEATPADAQRIKSAEVAASLAVIHKRTLMPRDIVVVMDRQIMYEFDNEVLSNAKEVFDFLRANEELLDCMIFSMIGLHPGSMAQYGVSIKTEGVYYHPTLGNWETLFPEDASTILVKVASTFIASSPVPWKKWRELPSRPANSDSDNSDSDTEIEILVDATGIGLFVYEVDLPMILSGKQLFERMDQILKRQGAVESVSYAIEVISRDYEGNYQSIIHIPNSIKTILMLHRRVVSLKLFHY
jgi:hypothetical protein